MNMNHNQYYCEQNPLVIISNVEMKFYSKNNFSNSIYEIFLHDFLYSSSIYNFLRLSLASAKIIHVIMICETRANSFYSTASNIEPINSTLSEFFNKIHFLNVNAKTYILSASCFGIHLHKYISLLSKGSYLITLSYTENTSDYFKVYSSLCFNDILKLYIKFYLADNFAWELEYLNKYKYYSQAQIIISSSNGYINFIWDCLPSSSLTHKRTKDIFSSTWHFYDLLAFLDKFTISSILK